MGEEKATILLLGAFSHQNLTLPPLGIPSEEATQSLKGQIVMGMSKTTVTIVALWEVTRVVCVEGGPYPSSFFFFLLTFFSPS